MASAVERVRGIYNPQREAIRAEQAAERQALRDRQSSLHERLLRLVDITGITRRRQDAARKMLAAEHRRQRRELTERYRTALEDAVREVRARSAAAIRQAGETRRAEVAHIRESHAEAERQAEAARQQREIEREHGRQIVEGKIADWRRDRKDGGPLGQESAFARALERAAKKEAQRGRGRGRDDDIERER